MYGKLQRNVQISKKSEYQEVCKNENNFHNPCPVLWILLYMKISFVSHPNTLNIEETWN